VTTPNPDTQRAESAERWRLAAAGWGRRADRVREHGMPVSSWMIDQLSLQPGQRVLELAAGPGDTGFLASELIHPGGVLVCSDASESMLEVARARARAQGIDNVEFKQLELEWIDLETASVDAVLCRWGIMLVVDPAAAVHEIRRVVRPGGRVAVAVWDEAKHNPWATVPGRVLIELGHAPPADPSAPGMFTLAPASRLQELLAAGGFTEVQVDAIELDRPYANLDAFIAETLDLSQNFTNVIERLPPGDRDEVMERIAAAAEQYTGEGGKVRFGGRSLVAAASA
jgi:SAM-dependent methyltransferase